MQEYVHMSPNFGKYKIIPILLLLPIAAFLVVLASSQKQLGEMNPVAYATSQPQPKTDPPMSKAVVSINDTQVPVEVANTEQKRSQGLSNRPPLEEEQGMLFVFPTEDNRTGFWMRQMYFNIDIIWINDGAISQIHENVPAPEDPNTSEANLKVYIPNDPYDYVLEMNAGSAEQYGFTVGDRVNIPTL